MLLSQTFLVAARLGPVTMHLSCIFPHKQSTTDMDIQGTNYPLLGDFHARIQQGNQAGGDSFTFISWEIRKKKNEVSHNYLTFTDLIFILVHMHKSKPTVNNFTIEIH